MIPPSVMSKQGNQSDPRVYERFFRSPSVISCDSHPLVSPSDPSPFSLGSDGNVSSRPTSKETSLRIQDLSTLKSDTDAALLLTSIKKLHVKLEPASPAGARKSKLYIPKLKRTHPYDGLQSVPSTISKLRSVLDQTSLEGTKTVYRSGTTGATVAPPKRRLRTVSLDLHRPLATASNGNDRTTDMSYRIPQDKITLDLTTNLHESSDSPAQVSPPSSPVLHSIKSIRDLKQEQGPRRLSCKKRTVDALSSSTIDVEANKKRKKQPKGRPSILRPTTKDVVITTHTTKSDSSEKKVLRKKFSWKSYPELEDFLIANREEYLRHSAMNYTSQQKEYNNRLTERLLELASECGYVFDEESFSFVSIRDRIRCYFKSYVQSKKKRGLILGYAARRKGLITEEELEKSAGIKGTIVVPKKSTGKKVTQS